MASTPLFPQEAFVSFLRIENSCFPKSPEMNISNRNFFLVPANASIRKIYYTH